MDILWDSLDNGTSFIFDLEITSQAYSPIIMYMFVFFYSLTNDFCDVLFVSSDSTLELKPQHTTLGTVVYI